MATIYRFIVENGGTSGKSTPKSGTGGAKSKSVKKHKVYHEKKPSGVEFNRYQRITTTIGNKMTNGMYSPALRVGKATKAIGTSAIAGTGVPILAVMIIVQAVLRYIEYELNYDRQKASAENQADFKRLEVGKTTISTQVNISRNVFTGRIKLNEND